MSKKETKTEKTQTKEKDVLDWYVKRAIDRHSKIMDIFDTEFSKETASDTKSK